MKLRRSKSALGIPTRADLSSAEDRLGSGRGHLIRGRTFNLEFRAEAMTPVM